MRSGRRERGRWLDEMMSYVERRGQNCKNCKTCKKEAKQMALFVITMFKEEHCTCWKNWR